jgi:hypothetical protein
MCLGGSRTLDRQPLDRQPLDRQIFNLSLFFDLIYVEFFNLDKIFINSIISY